MDMYLYSKKPKIKKVIKSIVFWILEIVLVVFAAYLVIEYGVEKTTMMDVSMSGTLEENEKIIINKLSYLRKQPERFDGGVFKQGDSEHEFYKIRRVIGVPGDVIEIIEGMVYINGEKLEEVIKVEPMRVAGIAQEPVQLQENEYFLLGDNRNSSEDSRFASVGIVVKKDIIGKAAIRLKPFALIEKINRED